MFAAMLVSAPPVGLSARGWAVVCVGVLMTVYWFTEPLPVTLTGLVPFIALPLLGVNKADAVAASYFSPVLFLILGGFFLALAMEKWGLHKRIALFALSHAGGSARTILLAIMATTAVISMFVSNSAATLAMLPVALAIISATATPNEEEAEHQRFGRAMVMGIAYGATLGGFGLIIGSPGNAAAVGIFQKVYNSEISFNMWAAFGLPMVLISIPLAWLLLSRVVFPFKMAGMDSDTVRDAVGDKSPWTSVDRRLLAVLLLAMCGWVGMPLIRMQVPTMSDAHVSLFAALHCFCCHPVLRESRWNPGWCGMIPNRHHGIC